MKSLCAVVATDFLGCTADAKVVANGFSLTSDKLIEDGWKPVDDEVINEARSS